MPPACKSPAASADYSRIALEWFPLAPARLFALKLTCCQQLGIALYFLLLPDKEAHA